MSFISIYTLYHYNLIAMYTTHITGVLRVVIIITIITGHVLVTARDIILCYQLLYCILYRLYNNITIGEITYRPKQCT